MKKSKILFVILFCTALTTQAQTKTPAKPAISQKTQIAASVISNLCKMEYTKGNKVIIDFKQLEIDPKELNQLGLDLGFSECRVYPSTEAAKPIILYDKSVHPILRSQSAM